MQYEISQIMKSNKRSSKTGEVDTQISTIRILVEFLPATSSVGISLSKSRELPILEKIFQCLESCHPEFGRSNEKHNHVAKSNLQITEDISITLIGNHALLSISMISFTSFSPLIPPEAMLNPSHNICRLPVLDDLQNRSSFLAKNDILIHHLDRTAKW